MGWDWIFKKAVTGLKPNRRIVRMEWDMSENLHTSWPLYGYVL